jgi:hypothetical protein
VDTVHGRTRPKGTAILEVMVFSRSRLSKMPPDVLSNHSSRPKSSSRVWDLDPSRTQYGSEENKHHVVDASSYLMDLHLVASRYFKLRRLTVGTLP